MAEVRGIIRHSHIPTAFSQLSVSGRGIRMNKPWRSAGFRGTEFSDRADSEAGSGSRGARWDTPKRAPLHWAMLRGGRRLTWPD